MSDYRLFGVLLWLVGLVVVLDGGVLSAQNLVVEWTFDEPAGGTVDALDTGVAPATNGVFGATATRTADTPGGKLGFAADLSVTGTNSTIDGGNPLEVDTLTQFTFSTWVKVTGTTNYNEGGSVNVRLLAKQSGGAFDGFSWNLNAPITPPGSQNAFRTGLFVGGNSGFIFNFSTVDILNRGGQWFFLAVTYDGTLASNNASFFIGDENTSVAQLGDAVTIAAGQVNSTNTSNGGTIDARFGVGFTDAASTADTALTGFQDEVRVYDGVLDLASLDAVRLANLPDMGPNGDYNDDGTVDAADYVVWRKTDGTQAGYDTWCAHFGEPAGSGSVAGGNAAVPEPATLVILIVAAVGIRLRRRQIA